MKTKQALDALDQAIAAIGINSEGKRNNEFTMREFAQRTNMSLSGANDRLASEVRKGIYKSRSGILSGQRMHFYSLCE
jgi:hypothetical protein